MLRWFGLLACLYMHFGAAAAFADPVTLRARVEANGLAITLGDVFEGAGDVAGRAIAPSPPADCLRSSATRPGAETSSTRPFMEARSTAPQSAGFSLRVTRWRPRPWAH